MPFEFTVSAVIPASPLEVYNAWLDTDEHTAMTGSPARASLGVGDSFDAWDGYIAGRNLELEAGQRIVQAWRTAEFTDADKDSKIEVTLRATEVGTELTLVHSNVPDGHDGYQTGWGTHDFEPMQNYFSSKTS